MRKVRHVWDGGRENLATIRETVRSETSMPSLRNSPWIRGAPQRIRGCHLVDERPNRGDGARAAGLFLPGSLRPAASQPLARPAHDGVCLYHEQGATPASPGPGEHDPEESIARSKTRSLGGACQRSQLLTKRDILKRDGPVPATDQSDRSENHDQRRQHERSCSVFR